MTFNQSSVSRQEPHEQYLQVRDLRLCYFEWGTATQGQPTYLLCHATGFHARCWDSVVAAVHQQAPNAHVVALDMRGHGRTDNSPPYDWGSFSTDLTEFVRILGLSNLIGAGHSMGGYALLQCAAALPEHFQRLVLVDPVVMDPALYADHDDLQTAENHPTSRRKAQFESWQAMRDRFATRRPFSLWRTDVLDDYCRYGLVEDSGTGGYTLACPPLVEASLYVQTTGQSIEHLLGGISQPTAVLRAKARTGERDPMDFSGSPTWPSLAAKLPAGVDLYLPELTHFIIMQAPELVAHCLLTAVTGRAELARYLTELTD